MGLLDWMTQVQQPDQGSPSTGLSGFLNTPMGTGLLSAVASYAANARRGTPVNNIGRGLMGGIQGYQGFNQQQDLNALKQAQLENTKYNALSTRMNIESQIAARKQKMDESKQKIQDFTKWAQAGGLNINPSAVALDESGNIGVSDMNTPLFLPISTDSQPQVSPVLQTSPVPQVIPDSGQGILDALKPPQIQQPVQSPFKPQLETKFPILTPEQSASYALSSRQKALGMNDAQFGEYQKLAPEDQYKVLMNSFNRSQNAKQAMQQAFKTASFEEALMAQDAGINPNDMSTWTHENIAKFNAAKNEGRRAGATNITNSPTFAPIDKSGLNEIGKDMGTFSSNAQNAVDMRTQLDDMRNALRSGNVFTGPMAETKLNLARWADMLGVAGSDTQEKMANTQTMIKGFANFSLLNRGLLKGQGQISNYEGYLLQQARSGNVNFSPAEMETIMNVAERVANAQYKRNYSIMKSAADQGSLAARMYLDTVPELPQPTPPKQQPQQNTGAKANPIVITPSIKHEQLQNGTYYKLPNGSVKKWDGSIFTD